MRATLFFNNYDLAKVFARDWTDYSQRGHTLSHKMPDGGAVLTLHDCTRGENCPRCRHGARRPGAGLRHFPSGCIAPGHRRLLC